MKLSFSSIRQHGEILAALGVMLILALMLLFGLLDPDSKTDAAVPMREQPDLQPSPESHDAPDPFSSLTH